MLFSELCEKEVVNIKTGARLGLIDDIEFDENTFEIKKLYLYGKSELLGLLGRSEDIIVDKCEIDKMGDDIVLVHSSTAACRKKQNFRHNG